MRQLPDVFQWDRNTTVAPQGKVVEITNLIEIVSRFSKIIGAKVAREPAAKETILDL